MIVRAEFPVPMLAAFPAAQRLIWLAAGLSASLVTCSALAQSMNANSAAFNAGYGRIAGSENHPVNVSTRDANGNRVIVDGLILTGEDQSSFSQASGAIDSFAGVGAGSGGSTAIGNSLVVVTQGNYNTVIVSSNQTNTGSVSAGTKVTTGGVGQ